MTSITLDLRVKLSYETQGRLVYVPGNFTKANIVHIALSGPMTSIVQQRTSLGTCATFSFSNPHYKMNLWQVCLVGGKTNLTHWWECQKSPGNQVKLITFHKELFLLHW